MSKLKVILVVDDHDEVRGGLAHFLRKRTDHLILEASNGLEGYHLAVERRPDLIVTDYDMPVMNGTEMFVKLHKELPTLPPTIFVSSLGSGQLRDLLHHRLPKLKSEDMPMVLTKPIDAGQLLAFIKGLLGEDEG